MASGATWTGSCRRCGAPRTSTCTGASGGLVDSVIDITHNVPVPFQPYMGGGLRHPEHGRGCQQRAGRAADGPHRDRHGCVEPLASGGVTAAIRSHPVRRHAGRAEQHRAARERRRSSRPRWPTAATIAPAADGRVHLLPRGRPVRDERCPPCRRRERSGHSGVVRRTRSLGDPWQLTPSPRQASGPSPPSAPRRRSSSA